MRVVAIRVVPHTDPDVVGTVDVLFDVGAYLLTRRWVEDREVPILQGPPDFWARLAQMDVDERFATECHVSQRMDLAIVERELEGIEAQIGLPRNEILAGMVDGSIPETEIINDWNQTYSSYLNSFLDQEPVPLPESLQAGVYLVTGQKLDCPLKLNQQGLYEGPGASSPIYPSTILWHALPGVE